MASQVIRIRKNFFVDRFRLVILSIWRKFGQLRKGGIDLKKGILPMRIREQIEE